MTAIDDKWASVSGLVGNPVSPETAAADGGASRTYERGVIYWHPQTGAHEVHGDILAKWRALGAEAGWLGYPTSDEGQAARGGAYSHFVGGSIYWRPRIGAFAVAQELREKWASMGWEYGIGFPLADALDTIGGEIRQQFEKAVLIWTPQAGVSVVHQPVGITKTLRVFLVSWADMVPGPAWSQSFFNAYFFGSGTAITNPNGNGIPLSISEIFSEMTDGYVQIVGEVMPWVRNPQRIRDVAHYFDGVALPGPSERILRPLGATVAQTLRTLGVRGVDDLKVNGIVPDTLVFMGMDAWAGGGARRVMDGGPDSLKSELRESGRLDLWDDGWNTFADMKLCLISASLEKPPARRQCERHAHARRAGRDPELAGK